MFLELFYHVGWFLLPIFSIYFSLVLYCTSESIFALIPEANKSWEIAEYAMVDIVQDGYIVRV